MSNWYECHFVVCNSIPQRLVYLELIVAVLTDSISKKPYAHWSSCFLQLLWNCPHPAVSVGLPLVSTLLLTPWECLDFITKRHAKDRKCSSEALSHVHGRARPVISESFWPYGNWLLSHFHCHCPTTARCVVWWENTDCSRQKGLWNPSISTSVLKDFARKEEYTFVSVFSSLYF